MATRSRTSFQKRQKEIARAEKQRDKAAKRAQRKLNPTSETDDETNDVITAEEAAGIEPLHATETAEGETAPELEIPSNGHH